jgi:hypothetical protein
MQQVSQNSVVKTMVNDKVLQETNRAIEQETLLNGALLAECNRAVQQEESLSGRITNEEVRGIEKENGLFHRIKIEKDRATNAEGNLLRGIGDEQIRASTIEGAIRADLTAEIARAQKAEQSAQSIGNDAFALALSNKQEIDSIHGMTARLDATSFPFVSFSDHPEEYAMQQQSLTSYALSQLHLENIEQIPNFIGVHNINGSHLFIFNAMQTEPSFISAHWVDDGVDTVSIADANNTGIVKGGSNVDIAPDGMMSIDLSGLREKNTDVVLLEGQKIKGVDKDNIFRNALMVKTIDTAKTQSTIIADIQKTVDAVNQVAIDLSTGITAAIAGIEHITGLTLAGTVNALSTIHIIIAYTSVNGAVVAYEQDGTGDFSVDLKAALAVIPPGVVITLANNGALDDNAQITNLVFTTYFFERKVQTELGNTDTHTEITCKDRLTSNNNPLAYIKDIVWGNIAGSLVDQADLQAMFDTKESVYTYQSWDVSKPLNRVEIGDVISGMRLYLSGQLKMARNVGEVILTDTFTLLRFTETDNIETGDGEVIYDGSEWLVEYIDIPSDAGAITGIYLDGVSLIDVFPSSIVLKELGAHTANLPSLAADKLDTSADYKNGVTETRTFDNLTSGPRMSDENDGTVSFNGFVTDPDDPTKQKIITTDIAGGDSTGLLFDKDKVYYIKGKAETQKTANDEIATKGFVFSNSQNVVRYIGQCDTQGELPDSQLRGGDQYRVLDLGADYNNHAGWATWNEISTQWDIVEDKQNVPDGVSLDYNNDTGAIEIKNKGVSVAKIADSDESWQFLASDIEKKPFWTSSDEQPTQFSRKPITSGTVYAELAQKANLYETTELDWRQSQAGILLTAGFDASDKRIYYNLDNIDFNGESCSVTFSCGGLTRELRFNSVNKNVEWGVIQFAVNGEYSQSLGYIDLAADLGASSDDVITVVSVNNAALLDWCDVWSLQPVQVKKDVSDAYELAKAAMNVVAPNDSGWQTLSLSTDFSGMVKFRKIGNRVSVWLNITPNDAIANTIGSLPVEYCPAIGEIRFNFGKNGDDVDNLIPTRGGINTDGIITIAGNTERAGVNMLGYIEYYVD